MARGSGGRWEGAEEPDEQEQEEQAAYGEFEPDLGVGGGEESFKRAGDDEQWNDAGDHARGFNAGGGYGVAPAVDSGKDNAAAEALSPAAPARTMEGSSSEPCGATKLQRSRDMPCCWQATPMTPSSRPLKNMEYSGPRPKTMPPAKASEADGKVVGHDEAAGDGGDG